MCGTNIVEWCLHYIHTIAQDGFALTERQVEEIVGLRQAFVCRWSILHAERCALVDTLLHRGCGGFANGSERGHARSVLNAHDVLRRLSTNLAKDHVAGTCGMYLNICNSVHCVASQC